MNIISAIYTEIAQPIIGFVGATASAAMMYVAQTPEVVSRPEISGWMQLGGTAGLIGGLSYACLTLWKALQTQRSEMATERKESASEMAAERAAHDAGKAALNAEIRGELKKQTQDLIEVLSKLDPDKP